MEPDVPPVVAKVVRKGDKNAMIHFSMGEPAWSPDFEIASKLQVGRPLPPDWKIEQGQYGPKALPPRAKGGGMAVAYRNTKEAFEAEAASRLAWQQVEEERKDRRTALMQAVEQVRLVAGEGYASHDSLTGVVIRTAEGLYEWLRSSPAVSEPVAERDVASKGEKQASPAVPGAVELGTTGSPAGGTSSAPRGQTGEKPGLGEDGADASASSGEVGADTKPGEGVNGGTSTVVSSPSPGFPISPEKCNHKTSAGHWVKWMDYTGTSEIAPIGLVCPKCGTSKLVAMESGGPYS